MSENEKTAKRVIMDLESVQSEVGKAQVALLGILTDDILDEWDEVAQNALLKLEHIQRSVGEVQVLLVQQMLNSAGARLAQSTAPADRAPSVTDDGRGEQKKESTPTDLQAWLRSRGITITSIPPHSGMDAAADRAALFLGDHLD
jgi:hypothetical protein